MVLSGAAGKHDHRLIGDAAVRAPSPFRLGRQLHEAGDVLRRDLHPAGRSKRVDPEQAEILVEVAELWRDHDRFDPVLLRPVDQRRHRAVAGGVVVTGNVESPQRVREQDGGEMRRRESCDHRYGRQDAAERQHRLDALAGRP